VSNTDRNRQSVHDLIEHLITGRLLDGFERYYAEGCVLSENGDPAQTRHGKATNREYETYFANHAEWHGVRVGPVIADGDVTAYEMWMDFTINGQRVTRTQWAVQQWDADGQIEKETFFYAA
jgi:hypothetical protein